MASPSAEYDSDVTISDMSSSDDVPINKMPPHVLDVQEEEVTQEQRNREVEVPQWLKVLAGNEGKDWRAFTSKRSTGHTDRAYIHKEYRHRFRSKREVQQFVTLGGVTTGIFNGSKLQKKNIAGMDAQDSGTSKSGRKRGASANIARPKRSLGQRRSIFDDEDMLPGFL